MGTVIALVYGSAPGIQPQLLARYLYSPYGEAHIEYGPELLRIEFDPDERLGQPSAANIAGALRIVTTLPLSPATFANKAGSQPGLVFEQLGAEGWEPIADSPSFLPDETEGSHLLAAPRLGWIPGKRYRITLKTTLADNFGRAIQLPEEPEVILDIPEDGKTPPQYQRKFPLRFDSAAAAAHTFENTFRGGQTSLFQGLWTDPVTGIAYARARWYDARHASWLSEDPVLDLDSPNLHAFVAWQPHMATDPMGEIAETPWDAASIGMGVISLSYNIREGNIGAALLDVFGIAVDTVAALIPGVPGGAGAGLKAIRSGSKLEKIVGALQITDQGINAVQGIYEATEAFKKGQHGWGAFYAGMSALSIRNAAKMHLSPRAPNPQGTPSPPYNPAGLLGQSSGSAIGKSRNQLIKEALSDARGRPLGKPETRGVEAAISEVERVGEWRLGGAIKYRGNQGIDLYFHGIGGNAGRFALAEAKASSGLGSLVVDRLGIRQGSHEFFRTRLARAIAYGDPAQKTLYRSIYRSLRSGRVDLLGFFYGSNQLFRFNPSLFKRKVNFKTTPGAAIQIN